jgi:ABC-type multidrug transport system fused ATPase/permease subunit
MKRRAGRGGSLVALWRTLDTGARRGVNGLLLLMLLNGLLEASGVISVVPLVAALVSGGSPCGRVGGAAGEWCQVLVGGWPLPWLAAAAFLLIAGSNVLAFIVAWGASRLSWRVWRGLAEALLHFYLQRPYEFYFGQHSAVAVKNIIFEAERLSLLVLMPAMILFSRALIALFIGALVVAMDPALALAAIGLLAGLYGVTYRRLRRSSQASGQAAHQARDRLNRVTAESMGGIKEIRMLGREDYFASQFHTQAEVLARQYVHGAVLSIVPRYLIETVAIGLMLGATLYLGQKPGGLEQAAPLLAFYVFAAYRLLPQFQQIYANAMVVQHNLSVVDEMAALLAEAGHVPEPPLQTTPASARPSPPVVFENVSYRYPGADRPALEDVSLHIPARSTLGLVGRTGAGKSTFIDLLAGLIHPQSGRILLDGAALDATSAPAWRTRIGYVPQISFLLDDSLSRNIALGLSDADIQPERVQAAARIANVHEFIMGLPQQYDTQVGERGIRLSGGQRQRILIARALYHNPEVLIFDEATSALDQETEQAILDAIRNLAHQKTILLVSHKPATLQWCDAILEVAGGRVTVQRGPASMESGATAGGDA